MKYFLCILLPLSITICRAQNPGDSIFNQNQILKIELNFSQVSFWDSLVDNYITETYMLADVTITDLLGIHQYDSIAIRLKGNSSYGHPGEKKSFKIDFNEYVSGQEYDGLRKLNFNNCFKDPTFMREKIIYDICRLDSINAPRCNYANVYMNDEFWGFYNVVEQVDDEFLKTRFDDKSENLFKAVAAFGMGGGGGGGVTESDLAWYGDSQTDYTELYELENNEDENDWSDLVDLIDFINNTGDDVFASELSLHFNTEQLMKSLALYNLFANLDSYINSARNYFIYNKDSSGVWEWINWDYNEAFGLYSGGPSTGDLTQLDIFYSNFNRPLLERILEIPETKELYETYYCEIKSAFFTSEFINTITSELYTLIQPSVYNDYNKMYSNEDFETNIEEDLPGVMGGTTYGLKSFVNERNSYLDDVLSCSTSTTSENTTSEILVFPNPADHFINIRYDQTLHSQANIQLFDISGNTIYNANTNEAINDFVTFETQNMPSGIYFLTITTSTTILTKKVIIYHTNTQ